MVICVFSIILTKKGVVELKEKQLYIKNDKIFLILRNNLFNTGL